MIDALLSIPWYRDRVMRERGPARSDGRLLRFGQGRRPPRRGVGALQGAGSDRRGQPRARRAGHALPRPRRQRRPRRRADAPRDPVAAAGLGRRHAARHRTGRDDPGQVRPARHRAAHARGLHDRDARGDARRRRRPPIRRGATTMDRLSAAARDAFRRHGLRRSALPRRTSTPRRRKPSSTRCTSAAGPRSRESPGRAAGAARDSVAVRVDADAAAAAVLARRRGSAQRRPTARSAARCTGRGRSSARPSS